MKEQVFCNLCGQKFTRTRATTTLCEFCRQGRARNRAREKNREVRAGTFQPPERSRSARDQRLKNYYGMTEDEFLEKLLEQGRRCAICRVREPGGRGDWHVDHDHSCCEGVKSCGRCVRGLLCARCNVGLGYFEDSTERMEVAIQYLKSAAHDRLPR